MGRIVTPVSTYSQFAGPQTVGCPRQSRTRPRCPSRCATRGAVSDGRLERTAIGDSVAGGSVVGTERPGSLVEGPFSAGGHAVAAIPTIGTGGGCDPSEPANARFE